MPKISASIIAWNEQDNIDLALKSIKGFVDEIIVFDNNSWDNTVKRAREWIKRLRMSGQVVRGRALSCGQCRQKSLQHCTGDWILFQDANLVFKRETAQRLRQLVKRRANERLVIGVSSLNMLGDYQHYMHRRMYNAAHKTLFKATRNLDFRGRIDRPHFKRHHFLELKHARVVNLSRVRPAWRCWYRGEPFHRARAWDSPLNRQYHWCRVKKYSSIAQFIEKTRGLTLKDVKKLAPKWYLKLLRQEARPVKNLNMLPEILREELKHPRFKIVYKNGQIIGRKPAL